ncbi:MAG: chemotaxis protein CheW [Desulfovibrionaceae bacterium]
MAEPRRAANQYLTFTLDRERYALDIFTVREVLEFISITRIPRTPEHMRGIINVRGNAVPVVDLNRKFGKAMTEQTILTSIIIVEVLLEGEKTTIGALADSVQEVIEMREEQIQPAPRMGTSIKADYLKGMGELDERFVMILDIDRLFTAEELASMTAVGGMGAAQACAQGAEATAPA